MNLALLKKLPVVFVCENNYYAMSTPTSYAFAIDRLSDRAKGYGIDGRTIDGNDVLMVRDEIRAAAEHDLSFYDKFSSGRIVSRLTSDTRDFGQLVTFVTDLISQFTQAIILAVVLLRRPRSI